MRSGDFISKAVLLGRGDVGPALKAIELKLRVEPCNAPLCPWA